MKMKSLPVESSDTFRLSKLDLTALITNAALTCINRWGVSEPGGNTLGPVMVLRHVSFMIAYRTPTAMIACPSSTFSIDVWYEGKKVFSTFWNSHTFRDYDLISLKRGPWIPVLLALAATCDFDIDRRPDK